MTAPGFPSQNPLRNRSNSVRSPVNGGLMEWLSWNFPTVHAKVAGIKRDRVEDYKSSDYASQHPSATGRTPGK